MVFKSTERDAITGTGSPKALKNLCYAYNIGSSPTIVDGIEI